MSSGVFNYTLFLLNLTKNQYEKIIVHMKDLRDLRQDKKIKAVYIARELGVSRAAVYYWEDGTYSPSYDKITKLAVLYGCSIEDINTAIMITKKHAIEREAENNA